MTQSNQDQAVNDWMVSLGFVQDGPIFYKDTLQVLDVNTALFFYTICQKAEREANLMLCQRLIEKNYKDGEIKWSDLGADVVNEKLRLLNQGVTPPQDTNHTQIEEIE